MDGTGSEGQFGRLRQHARHLCAEALARCSAGDAVRAALDVEDGELRLDGRRYQLRGRRRVVVIAAGKAAEAMLWAAYERLRIIPGPSTELLMVCVSPPVTSLPAGTEWFGGGHPLPNEATIEAGRRVLEVAHSLCEGDLVLFLISGGASAMLELPVGGIDLDDLRATYAALIGSGATIAEVNGVRKRLSQVKGGRLAEAAGAATQITLLVSDVAPGETGALAAGPTVEDDSSAAEALRVVETYRLRARFPKCVVDLLGAERPPVRLPADGHVVTVLDSRTLAAEVARLVEREGWRAIVDESYAEGEAGAVAELLLIQLTAGGEGCCVISCGEANVVLPAETGRGGRNQHLALLLAERCAGMRVGGACCGTDGVDGNSGAAGAVWDGTTVARAAELGLSVRAALEGFDAEPLFAALGDAIVTGPTGNNLRDLRLSFRL